MQINRNRAQLCAIVACSMVVMGCSSPSGGQAANEFVNGCADSDLNSKSVLYFGPSNQIGPGSVWSRLGPSGGYQPEWRMKDLGVDGAVIDEGKPFQCDLSKSSKFSADVGLSVVSSVANVSADVKTDFSRAKSVKVTSKGAAWDTIVAGPYKTKLNAIADASIRADVKGPNRIVLRRALRLEGYRVTMEFDSSVGPQIKAKYSGKLLGSETVGDAGASCPVPCDHVPVRSWPLFRAREVMREVIASLKREQQS